MVTLYVKTHNKTGLKYFGKTSKKDPMKYKGSGKYWLKHLNKHGNDTTTEIIKTFHDEIECKKFALDFSIKNNIVESKEWANLRLENGLDGAPVGNTFSTETIKKMSDSKKGKRPKEYFVALSKMRTGYTQTEYQKKTVSEKLSKEWLVTDPDGNIFEIKNLRNFCIQNQLDQGNLSRGKYKGWTAKILDK